MKRVESAPFRDRGSAVETHPQRQPRFHQRGIRKHLADPDPLESTSNKFRLRRPSEYAEYELRLEPRRVFDRVRGSHVEVVLIGEKRGAKLIIGGEEFVL